MKPQVDIISLGGTIGMARVAKESGVEPRFTAEDLIKTVPNISNIAKITANSLCNVPSTEIGFETILLLCEIVQKAEKAGKAGVVVTQGTDTLEEIAFALDLLLSVAIPVVVTGAMRHTELPGADGPANILAATICAASAICRNLGVLVVLGDEIHAARFVQKRHTSAPHAFTSIYPLGQVIEGQVLVYATPPKRKAVPLPVLPVPFVPIVKPATGDDGRLVTAALEAGARAMVIELSGGGHSNSNVAAALAAAAAKIPVVFSSRTSSGRVLRSTYGQVGGEIDLAKRGLINACDLDPLKARILLTLLVMANAADQFSQFADLSLGSMPASQ